MDFEGVAALAVGVVPVFGYVQDLGTYPAWFSIIDRVTPAAAAAQPGSDGGAWDVDLAARIGPFKRTKRVRMVRTLFEPSNRQVRFERRELDSAAHSAWVLSAHVDPHQGGSRLFMHLHYGGIAWVPGLDVLLREEARRAGARLERLLRGHGHAGGV